MKTIKKIEKLVYNIVKFFLLIFYKGYDFYGTENIPDSPCFIIGNHSHMNGPLVAELFFPKKAYAWCAVEMMVLKEVPAYTQIDFWGLKPKWRQPFYKILSYIIAPLSVCIFNSAKTIPTYHDKRIIKTFKSSIEKMGKGNNIIIFPEHNQPYNNILCDFQKGFVDVARIYAKKTGNTAYFVPMYISPKLRQVHFAKPIAFDTDDDINAQREKICDYIKQSITQMAVDLPRHKVIPYNNIKKSMYKYNREKGE